MRKVVLWLFAVLALPGFAVAGPCGDADGNLSVNVDDQIFLHQYLTVIGAPVPIGNADVDDKLGISFGDDYRLLMHFLDSLDLDCTSSGTYSLTLSTVDTLFLPRMLNIPDRVTHVVMNVRVSVGADAQGMCFPLLESDSAGAEHFDLQEVRSLNPNNIFYGFPSLVGAQGIGGLSTVPDTMVLAFAGHAPMTGSSEYFQLIYRRTSPGVCDLQPLAVNRDSLNGPVILRGDDLFFPQIVYTDSSIPEPAMTVVPDSLVFQTIAGERSSATGGLQMWTQNGPATFVLEPTEPWIRVGERWGTMQGFSRIWTDAAGLMPGTYTGTIQISTLEPTVIISQSVIPVTMTVVEPPAFPTGDINCNGAVDLTDLAIVLGYLKQQQPLPMPCQ